MALFGTVLHEYRIEVGGSRQRDGRGAVAEGNRAGLLRVASVLLIRLDRDSVGARRHRLVVVVEAVPFELVLSCWPRGACDRTEWLDVPVNVIKKRRKIHPVLRLVAPER